MRINDWTKMCGEWAREYRTKRERKPEFLFAHMHEEVSEAWKEWREGRTEQFVDVVKKHGVKIDKPEGLPAELADIVLMAFVAADEFDIDLEQALLDKFMYLTKRLQAKRAKNKKGSK